MIAALLAIGTTLVVQPSGPLRTLSQALAAAHAGDRIEVRAGRYREPEILVRIPVEISGVGGPVFEGGAHSTIHVLADSVTIRGLEFAGVTPTATEDRAAILLTGVHGCRILDNVIRDAYFGIYAEKSAGCLISGNRVEGPARAASLSGNGIHLWESQGMTITRNEVTRHRDGIYFEFVRKTEVRDNLVDANQRYGLHFMQSDSCSYVGNQFLRNGAGVAVMYSHFVTMTGNRFEQNRGAAAYGLLLKEISDGSVRDNRFTGNTVGLYLEDSNRNRVTANRFEGNGWAVKVLANASDNRFEGNSFAGNSFDVGSNSRSASSRFDGNYWERYRGYDLDRDGFGDVPHQPVRLFSLVVEQHEPALILLRSPFVDLLDAAERLLPILTPEGLSDRHPRMAPPR